MMMMLPDPFPQPMCRQAGGSGCMGLLEVFVNLDVTIPQVPGKKGPWVVPRVFLVPASGLYCCGDHGCSGEAGTVVLNLGAVAVKQMLCVEQRHLRRVFFVPNLFASCPLFLIIIQAAIIPVHSHSLPGGSKKSMLPLSELGIGINGA